MATGVNMCTLRSFASYVRCIINQQTRPLLTSANGHPVATREFCRRHCRTIYAESFACNVRFNRSIGRLTRVLYGWPCLLRCAKFMSSEQKPSIAEEVLKSNINETIKTAASDSRQESKTSSDKSNSWFGGKHAWKLGLLSLAGMGVLMCGNVLIMWGKYDCELGLCELVRPTVILTFAFVLLVRSTSCVNW